jgi:hypothetical protein
MMMLTLTNNGRRQTDLKTLAASHTPRRVLAVLRSDCSIPISVD